MLRFFRLWFRALARAFCIRQRLLLENLALRQQLATLKRKHPKLRVGLLDRMFWVVARRFWPEWKKCLIIVAPDTVVRWHRAGFRMHWNFIYRVRELLGRKRLSRY